MAAKISTFWSDLAERGVRSCVEALTDAESRSMAETYGTHNYHPLPINIVRGEGARVWDGDGNEYIDCIGAYSAVAHGHLSPPIVAAAKAQLDAVTLTSRATYASELALFLKGLADYCGLDMVCPMNTGAEAVETCLKLARKWGHLKKGIPDGEQEIIVCSDNFHGRTITIVGFSTEPGYRRGFGPFTPGFKVVPFGDAEALRQAITPNTCAFLSEPIQAEGGILIPPTGWLSEVRRICDETNTLLIWDEVQTGFCRTGRRMAWMHEDAKPDLLAVGKPLGGGILPVSAAVGRREVMEVFRPGDHGSTFGGNPLACAVALAALAEMEVAEFAERADQLGRKAIQKLQDAQLPCVVDVRGRGLLIGIEVHPDVDTHSLAARFLAKGVLTKETRHRTFRLTPPLMIQPDLLERALDRVIESLCEAEYLDTSP